MAGSVFMQNNKPVVSFFMISLYCRSKNSARRHGEKINIFTSHDEIWVKIENLLVAFWRLHWIFVHFSQ
jgi:hypothetical protein